MESRSTRHKDTDFAALYDRYFAFVWRTLRHLGASGADLSDACQEVFIVVHRRLPSFEARASLSTWIFQICFNLARDRRRRAHVRREVLGDAALEEAQRALRDPFAERGRRDRLALFEAALERMDLSQRAAFILFEIEGMTGPEVAEALDVPIGTAYSRLRAARLTFQEAVAPASDELPPARQGAAR